MLVSLKPVVNDPQGLVVTEGLHALGYSEVRQSRVGKVIRLELEAEAADVARARVDEMCRRLLCNGVIEDYRFQLQEATAPT
ncbi:MAG: phosphoribosylformylglycinamidine synthase subunit PurS [Candidatus Dormibacteria bacterium]